MKKSEPVEPLFIPDPHGCCSYAYLCPTTGEGECLEHAGFDACCDHPRCPGNDQFRNRFRQHKAVQCWCGNSWDLRPR